MMGYPNGLGGIGDNPELACQADIAITINRNTAAISSQRIIDLAQSEPVIGCLVKNLQRMQAFFSVFALSIIKHYKPLGRNSQ